MNFFVPYCHHYLPLEGVLPSTCKHDAILEWISILG
jgi:hypothetical protein